ncbi:MAG: GspH/FimT family pseudopilin [Psychromonas sp.]
MKYTSLKSSNGLTLIELMIVVSIIMILAMVGVPSYNTFIANERFAVATNELYNAYRFARNEAIKTSSSMTLEASGGLWTNGWQVENASGAVLSVSRAPHSTIGISSAVDTLTVMGMGSISGSMATFTVSSDTKTRCLTVLSSGQSELKDC